MPINERETLLWSLGTPDRRRALRTVLDECVNGRDVSPARFMRAFGTSELAATCARIADHVSNYNTLASILAELLREKGVDAIADITRHPCNRDAYVYRSSDTCNDPIIAIDTRLVGYRLTISIAQAFALRLLELPAVTISDVEHIVGELQSKK